MAKIYTADKFEVSGGVGANVLLDDGTTVTLPISFDTASSTRLVNTSGTNTGDNAVNTLYSGLISFDSTSSTRLANTSGTNTGDNAVNTLYSGLVTNATHTGEITGDTALTVQPIAISNRTSKATLVGTEEVLINDAGSLKKATAQAIADLASGGSEAATIIDDIAPTVVSGGFWFNPLSSSIHVGVGSAWVSIIGESGIDGIDGTNGTSVTAASGTGTVLSLTEIGGYYYNMASANSSTTYTTTGTTLGTFACVLINAATEPVVTGATKIKGSDFIANTNMHLWVQYFGVTKQYFFTEL